MKKFLSIIFVILMVVMVGFHTICSPIPEGLENKGADGVIRITYTDEALSSYIDNAAISYYAETGIHVQPTLVSGLEYIEGINQVTLNTDEIPDLYIVGNESLEKAILSGLATPLDDPEHIMNTSHFPQVALDAVAYQGDYIAYPFYYETSVFLYNRTYLEAIAAEAAAEQEDGDSSEEEDETETSEEETDVLQTVTADTILPSSLVGILEFSNAYDPPEGMESFLKWDVTDVLYNYGFAGAYMDMGGPGGDDRSRINLYNSNAIYALEVYQDFNQFFSIETKDISYESVIDEFIDGKIMFTFANTSIVETLERAREDGTFAFEYGIAPMEMLNTTLQAKPLSVTNAVVVNGYGTQKEIAEDFATYLCADYAENLYARSGKLAAYTLEEYEYEAMRDVKACYQGSIPIPKIVESGNFWVLAELCYTNIWEGDDVNTTLLNLANKINEQIYGESATEIGAIDTPEIVESYIRSE